MNFRLAISAELRGAVDDGDRRRAIQRQSRALLERTPRCGPVTARSSGWAGSTSSSATRKTWSLAELGGDVQSVGFKSALPLGMGGSSLCPEVLAKTFGPQPGFPELHIVDSTDPAQVMAACEEVDLAKPW